MTRRHTDPVFFAPAARRPGYLSCWHQAFAPAPERQGPLVEVWFDREPARPRRCVLQLPARGSAEVLQLTALYLAAVVNNTLCVWGAKRVSLGCRDVGLARTLCRRLTHLLFYQAEILTDLTPLFVFALNERHFGERLVIDADFEHIARLAEQASRPAAAPSPPISVGRHTVLAVNIGLYKTSCGLVTLNGADEPTLSRLTRQPTWPDQALPCYPALAEPILRVLAERLGALPAETEAVCLSLATPVLDGVPRAVARVGLTAACDQETADALGASLTSAVRAVFPGLPVFCLNDACAQGLFASRFGRETTEAQTADCDTELLSIRLGTCPSVSYIDAAGRNLPRLNEYAWLVTRILGPGHGHALLATISEALSFHGLGHLAEELGLLQKYHRSPDEAAVFFHDLCLAGDPAERHDAWRLYSVFGAHMAMLAYEIHRETPVRRVRLLGSAANRLDPSVFAVIRQGFAGFIARHALPLTDLKFDLAANASAQASLIGAAIGYGDCLHDKTTKTTTTEGDRHPTPAAVPKRKQITF